MSVKQTYPHFLLEDQNVTKHALRISRISRSKGIFSMDIISTAKNQTESSVKAMAERKPTITRFHVFSQAQREQEVVFAT